MRCGLSGSSLGQGGCLTRLVPALDLALGHRVVWRPADVAQLAPAPFFWSSEVTTGPGRCPLRGPAGVSRLLRVSVPITVPLPMTHQPRSSLISDARRRRLYDEGEPCHAALVRGRALARRSSVWAGARWTCLPAVRVGSALSPRRASPYSPCATRGVPSIGP